jgi:hypothetical protein
MSAFFNVCCGKKNTNNNIESGEMKMENQRIETLENKGNKVTRFMRRNATTIIGCTMLLAIMTMGMANASTADTLWTTISNLIKTWVTRLGAVVMFVGGIMFALGWKSDDAEQKSRGISTIIAGAIVTALAALTGTFFA